MYLHLRGVTQKGRHSVDSWPRLGHGFSHTRMTKRVPRPTSSHAGGVLGTVLQCDILGPASPDQAPFRVMVNTTG